MFKRTAHEIEEIIKICKENGIEATGSVFKRTAKEIDDIVKVCKANEIKITGSVFLKTAQETEEIVQICQKNAIKITGSIFQRNAKQLKENIEFIRENYGKEYLTTLIVSKNLKNLQEVLPYLQSIGVLDKVKSNAAILSLTLEEVRERQAFVESKGETIIKNGKFNSIFCLSRTQYKKKVKEFSQKQQLIEEIHEAIQDGQNLDGQIKIKESKVSGR